MRDKLEPTASPPPVLECQRLLFNSDARDNALISKAWGNGRSFFVPRNPVITIPIALVG